MKLTVQRSFAAAIRLGVGFAWLSMSVTASAQGMTTTTVQGTVYLANGRTGSGTLQLSWPAFTTAGNQAVAAGRTNVTIGADGYVSVKLAPNLGSTPAGLYYTAVYHLSDGTTSTEYWVIPAAAQASLAQVRAQLMPAAQAVQAVSKSYVDQSIEELTQSLLTASGGTLSGPLYLNGDPTQTKQAATKHYVDAEFANAVPMSGAALTGPLTSVQLGAAYQVDQFPGADFGARLQACLNQLDAEYGGTCDARNFSGTLGMVSALVIATANATVQLPCATIATANQIQVTAGTRNVTLHGCALRGSSNASGSVGGTVFLYSGSGPLMQVGDPTYTTNTPGFHFDNVVINTTVSADASAQGLAAYRTQELNLQGLYFLGNSNQTGMTLDGTGNYTGGTFQDLEFGGFGTAVNAIGHQAANSATTDWLNASTFLRLHIDCPTSDGSPVAGTYGINLQQGDGNTFTGGDVEGCGTAMHLGPNAQNNTIVGLRNENSISQVMADAGSSYNNWITGGTMFTGQLTDNGTRNSFLDTFHRSFNGLNGDWYGSQKDDTVTNHYRIGTGAGNERGLLNRYQTDYGYRWTTGLSDATAGEQFYQVLDELNNVYRISIGQYNDGQSSSNNQTVINAAGSGAVVLNGSANAGTGGVIFGGGGSNGATVATINSAGNAQFNGSLQVAGPSTFTSSATVKNQADAEIDSVLWAGATANQKESFIYKDYAGASQWYLVKDASNNWALNSAVGGLDSFKAYQSTNSGDTYINASKSTGHIRLNYESGSGAETDIYGGSNSGLVAAFLGSTAIKFPGLAAASTPSCLQIDNSGYISNTGTACGTGSSGMDGTVSAGMTGQLAYYAGNGRVLAGMNAVAVSKGGTGASTAEEARGNLGAQPVMAGVASDGASGMVVSGMVAAATAVAAISDKGGQVFNVVAYGADPTGASDSATAINATIIAANGRPVYFPAGTYKAQSTLIYITTGHGTPGFKAYGDGKGKSIIQCTAPFTVAVGYGGCIALVGVDGTRLFDYASGGWMRDLTITSSGSPANLDGLYVLGQNTLKVDHVGITGMTGDGIRLPLRLDWTTNPDAYASIGDDFDSNAIDLNGGNGINQECGLCAAAHNIKHNHIGENAKDGIVVGAHQTNIVDGNTIASNGSGTMATMDVPLSQCVGGGIVIKRIQTNPINVVIKGNGDFDSNCLYQIWEQASATSDISNNRFISHANGAGWPRTKQNVPAVALKMGFASQGTLSKIANSNYVRSDPVAAGVTNTAVDSPVTAFMFDFFNVVAANVLMNSVTTASGTNTGNLTPYGLGGGAILTCTGTGTPTCSIDQGGHYSVTPTLAVPAGYGCSGTPTSALTSGVITSIDMSPVTGCTSAPPFLIASVVAYPSSNSLAVTIADALGVATAPTAAPSAQYTITSSGNSITLWNSSNQLREENGTTPGTSAGTMTHRIYHDVSGTDSSGMDLDLTSSTNAQIKTFATGADTVPGISILPGVGGNLFLGSNNTASIQDDFANNSFRPVTAAGRSLGYVDKPWSGLCAGSSASANFCLDVTALTDKRTVKIPDAPSNTVQPRGSATAGQVVQWIGNDGVQHMAPVSTTAPGTVFSLAAPVSSTGSTSSTQVVNTARIPGGTMSATGKLAINIWTNACNGSGTPQAGCSATNTGTCTLRAFLGTTNSAQTTGISGATAVTAHNGAKFEATVRNQSSVSSQQIDALLLAPPATVSNLAVSPTTFNTASDLYVNVFLQNSVSGDTCFITQMDIVNWP